MARLSKIKNLTPANDHGQCPICSEPGVARYRPFCSKRCADVDLANWLGGNYFIPGGKTDDEDEASDRRGPSAPDMGQGD
ncbi:MAG: DNA gyrase inhibitor YacG [Hyphomicrobiaceae bacterium]